MPFQLQPLTMQQLGALSEGSPLDDLGIPVEPGALPPPFVAARALEALRSDSADQLARVFVIVRDKPTVVVGSCGFKRRLLGGGVEVGYGVAPTARKLGAASFALRRLCELAFEAGAPQVLAEVVPTNIASLGVVRRVGLTLIGTRVDEEDELVEQWVLHASVPASHPHEVSE